MSRHDFLELKKILKYFEHLFAISENMSYNRITGISERPAEKPARKDSNE